MVHIFSIVLYTNKKAPRRIRECNFEEVCLSLERNIGEEDDFGYQEGENEFQSRGVIWGGWGAVAPPSPRKKKKRRKKEKKKKEKKERNKKEGNYKKRQITTYKGLFFFQFSVVRWHWKIKKFWPPRKSWNDASVPESWTNDRESLLVKWWSDIWNGKNEF